MDVQQTMNVPVLQVSVANLAGRPLVARWLFRLLAAQGRVAGREGLHSGSALHAPGIAWPPCRMLPEAWLSGETGSPL